MPSKDSSIAVVGAGVFGLTLALQLRRKGYSNITVLDRHPPPVPYGSSVHVSRIIRSDYAEELYLKMAAEAIAGWESEYLPYYHESGILIISGQGGNSYLEKAKELVQSQGGKVETFDAVSPFVQKHLSTGGSGHAFKFLPVLGNYTCEIFEGSAPESVREKWAFKAGDKDVLMYSDGSRGGPLRRQLETWEQTRILSSKDEVSSTVRLDAGLAQINPGIHTPLQTTLTTSLS